MYVSEAKDKAVLSFRGTSKIKGDLGSDALLALGMQKTGSRFKNAEKAAKAAYADYGDKLSLTGHSLGGSSALYARHALPKGAKVETHAFAPHVSLFHSLKDSFKTVHDKFFGSGKRKKATADTTIYKTKTDPVSAFVSPYYSKAKVVTVKTKSRNPHSMSNFKSG